MKKILKRSKVTFLTLLLVLTIAVPLLSMPLISAHDSPLTIPTFAYLAAYPTPTGINQPVNIFGWLDKFPPTADGEYGDKWEGLTVTIGKPDGSTEVLGPYSSDPVGTIFTTYTPTMLGTYTFQFKFPGQKLAGANPPPGGWGGIAIFGGPDYIGDNFEGSTSETVSITVQQQQVPLGQNTPLPSGYWTRPIADSLTGWQSLAGNWLSLPGTSNKFTTAPETAHIVWTKPITFGGVANGISNDAYYTGLSYEGYFTPPIIISGVLYYNAPNPPMYGFKAVDLRTGEELWTKNGTGPQQLAGGFLNQNYPMLSFGQLLNYNSPNQHGYIPYLWSTYTTPTNNPFVTITNWAMYDAFTGNYICTIVGIPGGGGFFGASNQWVAPDGSILMYTVDLTAGTISVWNSTACIQNSFPSNSPLGNNGYWMWRPPLDGIVNGSLGITSTVPLSQKNLPPFASNVGIDADNEIMVFSTGMGTLGMASYPTSATYTQFGISLKPSTLGQILWTKDNPWPTGNLTLGVNAVADGVIAVFAKETRQWYAYSSITGEKLWGPSASETNLHMYGVSTQISNGKLYSSDSIGEGGTVYCYDAKTGALQWSKLSESMGNTGYWPNSPVSVGAIADGKLYIYGDEHSPGPTLEPGFKLRSWDANNGNELWSLPFWASGGFSGRLAIADGYLAALNAYDNQIYSFGKGQTATTLTANPSVIGQGSAVLIQGTVTDQSPGAKGTPAISDQFMSQWMEYVYQQQPKPSNVNGVSITLSVVGSSGTITQIGTVTSDAMGQFKSSWIPPTNDMYTITAAFAGSKSYFASSAQTGLIVGTVSGSGATANTTTSNDDLVLYIIGATIVILIALALTVVVLKRK